jgi:hypothetical protein
MEFSWHEFYERFAGHKMLLDLRNQFQSRYDYALIDSRTGYSDTAGICTIAMPDILVICLAFNRQSIEGSIAVAEAVDTQRNLNQSAKDLKIFPVPMRVEPAEQQKLNSARQLAASKLSRFLNHLPEDEVRSYWSAVESAFADTSSGDPKERSCFISYSSKDNSFAERLRADLVREGVRCWFAPHDMPIGAKIRPAIDKAIRENSRVILILSANSMASSWVEKEVESAFELEDATGTDVLVPVRLDAAILNAREGWAADIRRQRNIGDFTAWQDAPAYASALTRLLESLRT